MAINSETHPEGRPGVKAPLLLLALGVSSSVHASCDIISTNLDSINAEKQESLKKPEKIT